jgi:hypothetical protein
MLPWIFAMPQSSVSQKSKCQAPSGFIWKLFLEACFWLTCLNAEPLMFRLDGAVYKLGLYSSIFVQELGSLKDGLSLQLLAPSHGFLPHCSEIHV